DFFVSRRGDPLFFSSAGWVLVHRWHQEHGPLRGVLRGVADAPDGPPHSWGRGRKGGSLRFCLAGGGGARGRAPPRAAPGGGEAGDARNTLGEFAEAVRNASGLGPEGRRIAGRLERELEERALESGGRARELEPWLAAEEAALLAAIQAESSAGGQAQ